MKKLLLLILTCCYCSVFAQSTPDDILQQKETLKTFSDSALSVTVEVMPAVINSPFSEYKGMLLSDSTFVFTALHSNEIADNEQFFTPFWMTKMYSATLTISGFTTPKPFSKNINHKNYYTTNFTFNKAGDEVYFTRCIKNNALELQCHICKSKYKNGEWGKSEKLPSIINSPNNNTTFPHLVEKENYKALYFSSNRDDGNGGLDIWYAIIDGDEYQTPINLGDYINTEGNEITPYYDEEESKLYFSSDSWFGFGGYDVFYSEGALSQWKKVKNAGPPINSEYNDFYFLFNNFNRNGYFSSNRPNQLHRSPDNCCNDLFAFRWNEEEKDTLIVKDTITPVEMHPPLPILYFANDQPNPRTTQTTTNENYATLLANYLLMKDEYVSKAALLAKEQKEEVTSSMQTFFQDSVIQGYKNLELLSKRLVKSLQNGYKITLVIQGYASALHHSQYNGYLSQRRIVSVINYFKAYNNGVLLPYIENESLLFIEEPFGSEKAKNATKNENRDKKNGVYSLPASLDRKIEIKELWQE